MNENEEKLRVIAEDCKAVIEEAKSMGCNKVRALYNIPLENMELIVQALEKQIPKKTIPIDYEKYMNTVKNALFLKGAYWCPNCKHVVKCGTYCSDCGQKLDWGNEE